MNHDDDDAVEEEKLPELPHTWARRPSWEELEAALVVRRWYQPMTDHNFECRIFAREILERAARAVGLPALPPSYCEFLAHYGHVSDWRRAYRRDWFPVFLQLFPPVALGAEADYLALASLSEFSEQAHAVAEQLRPLIPFGTDASRTTLCWDPAQRHAGGELGLCFVDMNGDWELLNDVRLDCGSHLLDVFKYFEHQTDKARCHRAEPEQAIRTKVPAN